MMRKNKNDPNEKALISHHSPLTKKSFMFLILQTVYYSTVRQLEELSEVLDDEVYEKELWNNMELCRVEMERQMDTSEDLTNSKKAASRKSYFEQDNGKSSRNRFMNRPFQEEESFKDLPNHIQD